MKRIFLIIAAALFLCPAEVDAQVISYSQTKITKIKKEREKKVREKREKKPLDPIQPGFQQSVEIGGEKLINAGGGSAIVNYIAGYRFSNTLFIGGGVGYGLDDSFGSNKKFSIDNTYTKPDDLCHFDNHPLYYGDELIHTHTESSRFNIKAFANIQLYCTKQRFQPFINISIGGIYYNELWSSYHHHSYNGFCRDLCLHGEHERGYYSETDSKILPMINPHVGVNWRLNNKYSLQFSLGGRFVITNKYNLKNYYSLKVGFVF